MEAIEFEGEITFVAQAVSLAQERFDLFVDAFHPAVADPVFPPVEYPVGMQLQRLGQLLHLPHATIGGPETPFFEKALHRGQAALCC